MPRIMDYPHYRDYLKDYYQDRKSQNPRFSFGVWKRELGIKSPSTLVMILQGRREPGPKLTQVLSKHLKLNSKEREYFTSLVMLEKLRGKDPGLLQMAQEKLLRLNSKQKFRQLEVEYFRLYANWHNLIVLEAFRIEGAQGLAQVKKTLVPIIKKKAFEQSVETLISVGLLKKVGSDRYKPADNFESSYDVPSEALQQFHEGALAFAKSSVRKTAVVDRELMGCALAMSESRLPELKDRVRNFYRQLMIDFENKDNADLVVLMENAILPGARKLSPNHSKKPVLTINKELKK